ncbi:MAG: hypothetical protein JNK40_00525 [Chromatiales bacterium]|nr:hypothetical protein [Chromatiales bacterium]
MVRALVVALGLVLGVLTGAGLMLANPLAWLSGLPPLPGDLAPAKAYRWDNYRGIDGGVADLLGIARPDRAIALMDPALLHVRIGIVVLPAGEGTPAALAVKVSATDDANSLWRAQLGTDDYWSIFWPGEGSVFANAYSNYWAVARDAFFAGIAGGEVMAPSYAVTAPEPLGDPAGVTGASGRYAGFTGEIRELLYPAAAHSGPDLPDPGRAIAIKVNPPPVGTR